MVTPAVLPLQVGRAAPEDAEGSGLKTNALWTAELQLGRARPGGGGGLDRVVGRVGAVDASTGPRPGGRGGDLKCAVVVASQLLQLGRAPEGAEGR